MIQPLTIRLPFAVIILYGIIADQFPALCIYQQQLARVQPFLADYAFLRNIQRSDLRRENKIPVPLLLSYIVARGAQTVAVKDSPQTVAVGKYN